MRNKSIVSIIAVCLLLGGVNLVSAAGLGDILTNTYVSAGLGYSSPAPHHDGSDFGVLSVNSAYPIGQTCDNGLAFAAQLGSAYALVQDGDAHVSAYDTTLGVSVRNIMIGDSSGPKRPLAIAALFDYRREREVDLWDARPIVALQLRPKDTVGSVSVWHLNTDGDKSINNSVTGFWQHDWQERLSTSLSAGYEWGDIRDPIGKIQAVYAASKNVDLTASAGGSTGGDWGVGLQVTYSFGATGQHSTLINATGTAPFPLLGR